MSNCAIVMENKVIKRFDDEEEAMAFGKELGDTNNKSVKLMCLGNEG